MKREHCQQCDVVGLILIVCLIMTFLTVLYQTQENRQMWMRLGTMTGRVEQMAKDRACVIGAVRSNITKIETELDVEGCFPR